MSWMVAIILLLFYVVGAYAFHETSLIRALPYIAAGIVLVDFAAARFFRLKSRQEPDKLP